MKHPLIDHDVIEQCAKEAGVDADLCERLLELTLQAHDSQQPHDSLHTREGRNAYKGGIDRLITQHVEQELAANSKGGPS
jgi:predicted DsbA family dithiol-disulfide isomerase